MSKNNLYRSLTQSQEYIVKQMNLHEIEKAIAKVKGDRSFDKQIKKIWDRFIK